MAMIINDMDRLSQLPEPIMQQILFCLPAEDAVRMSFVSKPWQSLWNSLPVSDFSFHPIGSDSKWDEKLAAEEFVANVDESLRILHEHKGHPQKRIINYFWLMTRANQSASHHVDRWIKLVTKHYVRTLELDYFIIDGDVEYRFPPTSFDVGSLVELSLQHCVLDKALIQEGTRFSCLKELSLCDVDLNGLFGELLSRCPSIETLEFKLCENIKHLQVCEFPKLKNVSFGSPIEVNYSYKIEAANLQSLQHISCSHPLDFGAVNCRNLKELLISTATGTITNRYIHKLSSKFPFLEKLTLLASIFPFRGDENFQSSTLTQEIDYNIRF